MNLEIRRVFSTDFEDPADPLCFVVPIQVEMGEKGGSGEEVFHFVVASVKGLERQEHGNRSVFLRGYILLGEFSWEEVQRALEKLLVQVASCTDWNEVLRFLNRHGVYDSEDLDGVLYP